MSQYGVIYIRLFKTRFSKVRITEIQILKTIQNVQLKFVQPNILYENNNFLIYLCDTIYDRYEDIQEEILKKKLISHENNTPKILTKEFTILQLLLSFFFFFFIKLRVKLYIPLNYPFSNFGPHIKKLLLKDMFSKFPRLFNPNRQMRK